MKIALYNGPEMQFRISIDRLSNTPECIIYDGVSDKTQSRPLSGTDLSACIDGALEFLQEQYGDPSISAVGHRIVHGGDEFNEAAIIDVDVMARLRKLVPLAPLHQPVNLDLVDICSAKVPDVPQIASFDTTFHQSQSDLTRQYALPTELTSAGIRRYGFHGLSYESIVGTVRRSHPDFADGAIIIAHLGAGSSMCAVKAGESVATSMGFSTADGLPMATRSGSIDPGVLIYLMRQHDMDADALEELLYKKSGLIGLSGVSSSMQELRKSDDPAAATAINYFVDRCAREIGSLVAALGRLDAIVFTGGIGQNDAQLRQRIAGRCEWLGVEIDQDKNDAAAETISSAASKVHVVVIPADEEGVIAAHALRLID